MSGPSPPSGSGCPSWSEIEARLRSCPPHALDAHASVCNACRDKVDSVRSNLALLAELRQTTQGIRNDELAIDGYRIVRELRRGGQGVVYEAVQLSTSRRVALKVLLLGTLATRAQRRRFEREVQLVARLDHPGVVTIYDSGFTRDGCPFLAMQLIEGAPLDEWHSAAGKGPDPEDAPSTIEPIVRLVLGIGEAVQAAHERGIIHRDLKPENVLVDRDGRPHLLDFGLARSIAGGETQTAELMGTLHYLSPEQVQNRPVDERTDLHALGVILYELLAGHRPFEGSSTQETLKRIGEDLPQPVRSVNPRVPRDLETICLKVLSKEPCDRYPSVTEFNHDLRCFLRHEAILARPIGAIARVGRWLRRHRRSGLALLMLLIVGVLGLQTWLRQRRLEEDVRAQGSILRLLRAHAAEESLRDEDLLLLERVLPDPAARAIVLENPFSEEAWQRLRDALPAVSRTEPPSPERLLTPRAVIVGGRPTFRFEVPGAAGETWSYVVILEGAERAAQWTVLQRADQAGPLVVDWPEDEPPLAAGEYRWQVRLDEDRHGELVAHYRPQPVSFRVLEASSEGEPSGEFDFRDGPTGLLLRAARLLSDGRAADALDTLDPLPAEDLGAELAVWQSFLRARARVLLEDAKGFEVERRAGRARQKGER